jgi:mono/diheme cytochrome c family protein
MKLLNFIFSSKNKKGLRLFPLSILLTSLFLLANLGFLQLHKLRLALASTAGAELFKSKCSKCHDLELALRDYRSAEVWQDTITRMKEEHNADISQEETELLVKYHVAQQKQEAAIFKEKCEKCHPGKVFLAKSLTAEQTRAIIRRMQQKAGNTIEDNDIDIIIRYHARSRMAVLKETLGDILGETPGDKPGMQKDTEFQKGMALFAEKCSACHELQKALSVIKDPEVWEQTIKRMQSYSKGTITDQEVQELVDFHVTEQQREINTFRETCTVCHDDERINRRSMSEEQWLATIKRMQKKAPELITDEKVSLLTAYFHRRELAMAKIFYGKCQLCHYGSAGKEPFQEPSTDLGALIVLASEEFGDSFQIRDMNSLLSFHALRQNREMQLYRKNCRTCHRGGPPTKTKAGKKPAEERNRTEWISFIAVLQGLELNDGVQAAINSQIDYHISIY